MKFSLVAQSFQKIEKIAGRLDMTYELADLLKQATPFEAEIICNLSLGQLYPPYVSTQFNIAETLMVYVVADVLDSKPEAITLQLASTGDLGTCIETGTWKPKKELSVEAVYEQLCLLEKMVGIGSQDEKRKFIIDLIKELDPISGKFLLRIILAKLRLGFSDMTLIDALSYMYASDKSLKAYIEHAYNVCADIGHIAHVLKEHGIDAVQKMHSKVGTPIRPASAERLSSAQAIIEKIGPCVAQPKIDGFRLQIHINKTDKDTSSVTFFSRHLTDMSAMFPDLTAEIIKLPVISLIAEGEAIVYDPDTQTFLPFQETIKRRRKYDIATKAEELPLQLIFFDLLYLNGQSLLQQGHEQRRKALQEIIPEQNPRITIIEEKSIQSKQELEDYFMLCITMGLEGLVVKRPNAPYQAGKRNFNWIKLKRQQQVGKLQDTIDCVVLGYYTGSGKRASFGIGAFLVGSYNSEKDCFETLAKVGTGLKDSDWIELRKKCDALLVKDCPKNVVCPKQLYPDVWVYPEIVVLIRADDITQSPLHTCGKTIDKPGYALRFPRFIGYRPDKGALEATTSAEVASLYTLQFSSKKIDCNSYNYMA